MYIFSNLAIKRGEQVRKKDDRKGEKGPLNFFLSFDSYSHTHKTYFLEKNYYLLRKGKGNRKVNLP